MTTATQTTSGKHIPQYTKIFVKKIGTRGPWREHCTTGRVGFPNGARRTLEPQFCEYGETNYFQFQCAGWEIVVSEDAVMFDEIEDAKLAGPGECPKCLGKGFIDAFRHVANGECFWCKGKGKV